MKNLSLVIACLIILFEPSRINAQDLIKNSRITGVCYAGNKVNRIYVPPPDDFFRKSGNKGGASVTFLYSGFSASAITAMEYAASILEAMLPSDVEITVQANWTTFSSSGVLANSSVTGYAGGWAIDALNPNAFYPVALAEKIAGEKLNPDSEGDILLNVNRSVNWYFGTDGKTPSVKYDLVTVAIHEICHGLGFFSSMYVDGNLGWYGLASIPLVFDTFIENAAGQKLTDTLLFDNPSLKLKDMYTSGQLFFNGPLTKNYTTGSSPLLYAPSTFDEGSSIAHLDESATLLENSLMTPFIEKGEAIHNPGKLIMSIMGDIGWINTRIDHDVPNDTEDHISEITISASIVSDTAYKHNKVHIFYSFDKFIATDTILMSSPLSDNNYSATIQIPSYETRLEYYIAVEDVFSRVFRSPSFIEQFRHTIYIGTDTAKPEIIHTPVKYLLETDDTVRFNAEVTDNIGVDTVFIEFKINEGTSVFTGLTAAAKDNYEYLMDLRVLNLQGGDTLFYRLVAKDKASAINTATLPEEGFFSVAIEDLGQVVDQYSTDFSDASKDFFNIGFEILKPSGFSSSGLHSRHPYESPEENGDSIVYTSMLRKPVKFDGNGMIISYRDVALIEPGEAGSAYGSVDFFDYVVVEGSGDFGKSWFPLSDGYDSRYRDSWLTAYNSLISEQNSIYTGNESMMIRHTLFPKSSQNISGGDTMLLRFRLFSDPYANGWGWAIQDFNIGPLINDVESVNFDKAVLYPNPGTGLIAIKGEGFDSGKPVRYSILNITGIFVASGMWQGQGEFIIDISDYPQGFYILVFHHSGGIRSEKYYLIK